MRTTIAWRIVGTVVGAFSLIACSAELSLCPIDDGDTVAIYRFDEGSGEALHNSAGSTAPDGVINAAGVSWVGGPCGGALRLPATTSSSSETSETEDYAYLPPSDLWKLKEGSVELWLRLQPISEDGEYGILSRDAQLEAEPGHLSFSRIRDKGQDYVALRIQDGVEGASAIGRVCGAARIGEGDWHHVGFNFGGEQPAELFMDGVMLETHNKEPVLRVNCGSNDFDVAGWKRDDAYVSGGEDWTNPDSIDSTSVDAAAPADVYRSVRHKSPHSYDLPLPNDAYVLRLHFVDRFCGSRAMKYVVEGQTVLDDFDVCAVTGGTNRAYVKSIKVTVSDGDGMQIEASGDGGVLEAGFEVYTLTQLGGLQCTQAPSIGIAGNNEPWVIGAFSHLSAIGSHGPSRSGLGGDIATLRVSRRRRDFSP